MPGATFQQTNWTSDNAGAYPPNIDGDIQVLAQLAAAFAPHAVPPAVPSAVLSQIAGGALSGTTYFVRTTYVTAGGFESAPSSEVSLSVSANNLLQVAPPGNTVGTGQVAGVSGWNVYVSTSGGTETRQNGSTPIAIGTAWTEPTSGLVAGAALPAGLSAMKILVDAGLILYGGVLTSVAQQLSALFTAPVTNPRIDRVVYDPTTGLISNVTGTEAGSPTPPAIPGGQMPCAQVSLIVGQTVIGNSSITPERTLVPASSGKAIIDLERLNRRARNFAALNLV